MNENLLHLNTDNVELQSHYQNFNIAANVFLNRLKTEDNKIRPKVVLFIATANQLASIYEKLLMMSDTEQTNDKVLHKELTNVLEKISTILKLGKENNLDTLDRDNHDHEKLLVNYKSFERRLKAMCDNIKFKILKIEEKEHKGKEKETDDKISDFPERPSRDKIKNIKKDIENETESHYSNSKKNRKRNKKHKDRFFENRGEKYYSEPLRAPSKSESASLRKDIREEGKSCCCWPFSLLC